MPVVDLCPRAIALEAAKLVDRAYRLIDGLKPRPLGRFRTFCVKIVTSGKTT